MCQALLSRNARSDKGLAEFVAAIRDGRVGEVCADGDCATLQRLAEKLIAGPIDGLNEAETIARFAWRTPAARILLERVSTNTRESAKEIRKAYPNIRRVVLVSDAVHSLCAVPLFAQAGFDVVPAPTRFADVKLRTPGSFVPSAHKLAETRAALHAALGYLIGQ